jgi:hypothetical protein
MNLTNKLVEKFGADKLLHFLLGWVIVSLGNPFGYIGIFIATFIACLLSAIKEFKLDAVKDIKDLIAGCLGAASSGIYFVLV